MKKTSMLVVLSLLYCLLLSWHVNGEGEEGNSSHVSKDDQHNMWRNMWTTSIFAILFAALTLILMFKLCHEIHHTKKIIDRSTSRIN